MLVLAFDAAIQAEGEEASDRLRAEYQALLSKSSEPHRLSVEMLEGMVRLQHQRWRITERKRHHTLPPNA